MTELKRTAAKRQQSARRCEQCEQRHGRQRLKKTAKRITHTRVQIAKTKILKTELRNERYSNKSLTERYSRVTLCVVSHTPPTLPSHSHTINEAHKHISPRCHTPHL